MTRVGLVGPPERAEIERLAIRLEERGAEAVFLDARRNPEVILGSGRIEASGENLSGIRSLYVCDLGIPSPFATTAEGRIDVEPSLRALDRSRRHYASWKTLLDHLSRRALVVNPPDTYILHAIKPYETTQYEQAGMPVPFTVSTTDPEALAALTGHGPGEWIAKGMVGGVSHTEALQPPRSREEAAGILEGAAVMAQERIQGDNVRAFVIDGECIGAAEVIPLTGAESDSRRGATRVRRIALPLEAERDALSAARRWGMTFAAVDFMRESATGRFVLLECNSAPFFVNFEARTGIDVSGRLAAHLLGKRSR